MTLRAPLLAMLLAATALPAGLAAQTATDSPAPADTVPATPTAPETEAATEAAPADATAATAQSAAPAIQPGDDIVLGAEDAPLTIIEYASFTCIHCAAFHQDNFPRLKADYIDTGKVRFIQRDVYFDAVGLWAGVLARCEPAKFYPVSGMLLDEQGQWLGGQSGEEIAANLRRIGLRAGMTEAQMQACWDDEAMVQALVGAYQTNAAADEINATPTFIIGDQKVPNQSWDSMTAIIDAKLAEAEQAAQ